MYTYILYSRIKRLLLLILPGKKNSVNQSLRGNHRFYLRLISKYYFARFVIYLEYIWSLNPVQLRRKWEIYPSFVYRFDRVIV